MNPQMKAVLRKAGKAFAMVMLAAIAAQLGQAHSLKPLASWTFWDAQCSAAAAAGIAALIAAWDSRATAAMQGK